MDGVICKVKMGRFRVEYAAGIAMGVVFGGVAGAIKYFALWRKMMKTGAGAADSGMNAVYVRMMISWVINIVTLLAIFFIRKSVPWDFTTCAIAAAVALSLTGKLFPLAKIMGQDRYAGSSGTIISDTDKQRKKD